MTVKLYVLPASHPCAAVEAALKLKSIAFDRVDLLPMTQLLVGPPRYSGKTVPGIRIGDERLVGSRRIMRRLDELTPEPPLLPAPTDPAYARVLEAERWGDEELQGMARDILPRAFVRNPAVMESFVEGDFKLPLPRAMLRPTLPLTARLMTLRSKTSDQTARATLAALPAQLDRVDAWLAEGVLGGEQPNAADLQIGSTIRLLSAIEDVRPMIDAHPASQLTRYFLPMTGRVPHGVLPAEWLPLSVRA